MKGLCFWKTWLGSAGLNGFWPKKHFEKQVWWVFCAVPLKARHLKRLLSCSYPDSDLLHRYKLSPKKDLANGSIPSCPAVLAGALASHIPWNLRGNGKTPCLEKHIKPELNLFFTYQYHNFSGLEPPLHAWTADFQPFQPFQELLTPATRHSAPQKQKPHASLSTKQAAVTLDHRKTGEVEVLHQPRPQNHDRLPRFPAPIICSTKSIDRPPKNMVGQPNFFKGQSSTEAQDSRSVNFWIHQRDSKTNIVAESQVGNRRLQTDIQLGQAWWETKKDPQSYSTKLDIKPTLEGLGMV